MNESTPGAGGTPVDSPAASPSPLVPDGLPPDAGGASAAAAPSHAPTAPAAAAGDANSLRALYDLTLPVSIELGRTRMLVRDVLNLGRGSVVELERLVGEPVDVYVGDRAFAKAEVVVVGEQFGVRITRILAPAVSKEEMSA